MVDALNQQIKKDHGQELENVEQMQLVVFKLDGEEYGLPIEDVREILDIPEITPVPNNPPFIAGIINVRGRVIAVVDLEKRFELSHDSEIYAPNHIVVIDVEDGAVFGVMVDQVTEVLRLPVDALQAAPQTVSGKIGSQYIRGIVVLSEDETTTNERIILVLNISQVLTEKDKSFIKEHDNVEVTT